MPSGRPPVFTSISMPSPAGSTRTIWPLARPVTSRPAESTATCSGPVPGSGRKVSGGIVRRSDRLGTGKRGAVGFQPPEVRLQSLFDLSDVFWEGGDFPLQIGDLQIERLQSGERLHEIVRGDFANLDICSRRDAGVAAPKVIGDTGQSAQLERRQFPGWNAATEAGEDMKKANGPENYRQLLLDKKTDLLSSLRAQIDTLFGDLQNAANAADVAALRQSLIHSAQISAHFRALREQGFSVAEIDRMQLEVREYLLLHPTELTAGT